MSRSFRCERRLSSSASSALWCAMHSWSNRVIAPTSVRDRTYSTASDVPHSIEDDTVAVVVAAPGDDTMPFSSSMDPLLIRVDPILFSLSLCRMRQEDKRFRSGSRRRAFIF